MQKLRERLKDQKGFTLVEMLIVVAIIAILVAVSIPMMNSTLEKTRHAVDEANMRDAIGLGNIYYLTEQPTASETVLYYYVNKENHQGQLDSSTPVNATGANWEKVTPQCSDCSGTGIKVTITNKGEVTAEWDS